MAEAKTKSENMIQGIILNAFAIAMGFVVYRVITKMVMGGNGIELMASASGCDVDCCCGGPGSCTSVDNPDCEDGFEVCKGFCDNWPENMSVASVHNDIATISAQPSERMLPNKFAQMAYRSDVSDSSSMPIKQRNLSFKF
jgi:hypothetical protein